MYVDRNLIVLRLVIANVVLGVWTCSHGTAWSNDTVNITSKLVEQEMIGISYGIRNTTDIPDKGEKQLADCSCTSWIFIFVIVLICGIAALAFSASKMGRSKIDKCKKWVQMQFKVRREGEDSERQGLIQREGEEPHGICGTCNKDTSYAFCSCENWFCEHCSEYHHRKERDHHIAQTIHEFDIREPTLQCKICKRNAAAKVCKVCSVTCCDKCDCGEPNHFYNSILKSPQNRLRPDREVYSKQKELKRTLSLPPGSDIIGLACVSNETVVVVEFSKWEIYIFRGDRPGVIDELDMEPRALTKIRSKTIAISFAYTKCIRIFEIQHDKVVEHSEEKIYLTSIGKPYSISYSNGLYAVEVGERKNGFIAVITEKGDVKHRIPHSGYSFGYFTGNTLRLYLETNKQLLYISAIGKKSIYCVKFDGTIRWNIKVPSPREMQVIPSNSYTSNIIYASNMGNAIHQLKGKDEQLLNNEVNDIVLVNFNSKALTLTSTKNPENIAYNPESKLMCIGMEKGLIYVYHFPEGL